MKQFGFTADDLKIPTDRELDYDIERLNHYIRVALPVLKDIIKRKISLYLKYKWRYILYKIFLYSVIITAIYFLLIFGKKFYNNYYNKEEVTNKVEYVHNYMINNPISKNNLIFMNSLSLPESGGDYNITNGQYWGKYQLGEIAREELKLDGFPKELFLGDQYIQDWAMDRYLKINYKYLKKYIEKYNIPWYGGVRIGNYVVTISGLLAASHFGFNKVIKFLNSNGTIIETDGNNVPITKYFMFNNLKLDL